MKLKAITIDDEAFVRDDLRDLLAARELVDVEILFTQSKYSKIFRSLSTYSPITRAFLYIIMNII